MQQLYDQVSFKLSKVITNNYSTSFSLGISVFAPKYRKPIYAVYGFVRLADEIVDSFHNYDKKTLLKEFREETHKAINNRISTNPVLHSFQQVVNEYNIDIKHIDAFLNSMEMDLYKNHYDESLYDRYIYGSAEVVGLMCLKVFVNGDQSEFDRLLAPARSLGSAFQKVNFLRDIKSDIEERGRIYLPGVSHVISIDNVSKRKLEIIVEKEFDDALIGINQLPAGVKLGVYTAYLYYRVLFNKIKNLDIEELMEKRVRVPNHKKIFLLFKSIIKIKILQTV